MSSPALCNPLTADSRPAPGPFRLTSTSFIPWVMATFPASCAATVAAKAEDLRDPEKFTFPADAQARTFPAGSVIVTIVLLKEALTCATPDGTCCPALFFGLMVVFFGVAGSLDKVQDSSTYFFLLATVLRRPLRVLELVRVRCPRTGKPVRWRSPR